MKYLIAGLGNPGEAYKDTRHNVGFMVLERLLEKKEIPLQPDRYASSAMVKYKGKQLHLILPTTYMNLSGNAIRFHLNKHKLSPEQLLVITDDLALPFGKLRMRGKGSDGGHNGLKHIQETLGTQSYARIKFGIGDEFSKGQQVDYVLGPFSSEEQAALPPLLDACIEGIFSFVAIGLERTMNTFNSRA